MLDLFAGTGALGLEALSRGAAYCLFVEEDAEARGAIRRNIEAFGLTGVTKIFRRDATTLGPAGNRGSSAWRSSIRPTARAWPSARWRPPLPAGGWRHDAVAVIEERKGATVALPRLHPPRPAQLGRHAGAVRALYRRPVLSRRPQVRVPCPLQNVLPRRIGPSSSGFARTCGWPTIARSTAAVATGQPVLALYVFDEDSPGVRPLGGASRWWLHHSLATLAGDLDELGHHVAHLSWRHRQTDAQARDRRQRHGRVLEPALRRRRARRRHRREVRAAQCGHGCGKLQRSPTNRTLGNQNQSGRTVQGVHAVLAHRSRAERPAATAAQAQIAARCGGADISQTHQRWTA